MLSRKTYEESCTTFTNTSQTNSQTKFLSYTNKKKTIKCRTFNMLIIIAQNKPTFLIEISCRVKANMNIL